MMRKHSLARMSLLGLALVLVLGVSGAAFAKWCDSVVVQAVVDTGEVDVRFLAQKANDWPGLTTWEPDITSGDPAECGVWQFPDIYDPSTWTWAGGVHIEEKEVASTSCEILASGDRMKVTVENGYPCYWGDVAFSLDNIGTIPVRVSGLRLISVKGPGGAFEVDQTLDTATVLLVDADTGTTWPLSGVVGVDPAALDYFIETNGVDFSVHLSELADCQQIEGIDDGGEVIGIVDGVTAIPGDICVHVEQAAKQKARYEFVVEIVACQWNEVTCLEAQKVMPAIYEDCVDFTWTYPGIAKLPSYFDVTLAWGGVDPAGWFPGNGRYDGWCMDSGTFINANPKLVDLHSTLDPGSDYYFDPNWRKVNWMLNHVPRVEDDLISGGFYTWGPLQRAIWYFVDESGWVPPAGDSAWDLINVAQYHGDYIPSSGEMHAVICELCSGSGYQKVFIEVDP